MPRQGGNKVGGGEAEADEEGAAAGGDEQASGATDECDGRGACAERDASEEGRRAVDVRADRVDYGVEPAEDDAWAHDVDAAAVNLKRYVIVRADMVAQLPDSVSARMDSEPVPMAEVTKAMMALRKANDLWRPILAAQLTLRLN